MDVLDRPDDHDDAFRRLREVLGAPDRRGWRRHLPSRTPRFDEADDEIAGRRPPRPRLAALAALPLLGAAAVLLVSIARPSTPVSVSTPAPPSSADADTADETSLAPPSLPQQVWPAEEVTAADGEVRVGRQRWSVGAVGDVVVIGDWNCDRQPTPAVLRPKTGGFYVFDGWAAPDRPATARKVADVPGATAAVAAGCGSAVVRTADGAERRIDTEVVQ